MATRKMNIYAQSNSNLNLLMKMQVNRTGEALDLSDYKADMEIRERKEGYVLLAKLSSHLPPDKRDGVITLDENGFISLNLNTNILLNKVKQGTWYYDLVLTDPNGIQSREIEGVFSVDGSTTIDTAINTDPQLQILKS